MKATPEGNVKRVLISYLRSLPNTFYYSAAAGPYSTTGIPDIVGCCGGKFFAIEVKAPGRRGQANRGASGMQVQQMSKIAASGGFTMIFDGGDDDWEKLKAEVCDGSMFRV